MKTFFLTFIVLALQAISFAQINIDQTIEKDSCNCKNEKEAKEYFEQFKNDQKFIEECQRQSEEKRKSLNSPKRIKVSGFGPRPVHLVKPSYPLTAKRSRIYGEVTVQVFTDEKGFVTYSKILKGNRFLSGNVRKAACLSKFTPIIYCEKPIKTSWIIKYQFTLS